jgi:hypothetical protein
MHRLRGVILLPLLLLAGCPTKAKPGVDTGDQSEGGTKNDGSTDGSDRSDGSTKSDGSTDTAPSTPTLQITSPTDGTYTNGTVTITVTTSGAPAPAMISLFLDGGVTAIGAPTVTSPHTFAWDTTGVTEGPHTIVARGMAAAQAVTSAPVMVNVDRTAPKVMSTIPATGVTDVVLRAPITLTFSEAIAKSSVTSSSATLTIAGTAVATTMTLGSDGTTAAIVISDLTSFVLPAAFSVTLASTITDLAGNALSPPSIAWSWTVPDFVSYGSITGLGYNISAPSLAITSAFQPTLAYVDLYVSSSGAVEYNTLHVQDFGGQGWIDFGRPASSGDASYGFSLALDANDHPVIAWSEHSTTGGTDQTYVATWRGTAWGSPLTPVDPLIGFVKGNAPVVRLDTAGLPVVGWLQKSTQLGGTQDIFVTRWTGTQWRAVPGELGLVGITAFDLILNAQDDPIVAWRTSDMTGVYAFRGTTELVSPILAAANDPTLGLDKMSDPLLVEGARDWAVSAFAAGAWQMAVPLSITGDGNSQSPKLRTGPDHNPVVGWVDAGKFAYARWTGSSWDSRAGLFSDGKSISSFDICVDSRGTVWMAGNNASRILVMMSNY